MNIKIIMYHQNKNISFKNCLDLLSMLKFYWANSIYVVKPREVYTLYGLLNYIFVNLYKVMNKYFK